MSRMRFSPVDIRQEVAFRHIQPQPHRHPLLSDFSEVEPFPSNSAAAKIYRDICGKRHPGHNPSLPSQCYMHYAKACFRDEYAAKIPGTDKLPFDTRILPNETPVLEHLKTMLVCQSKYKGGGSFYKFIHETVEICMDYRQVTASTKPQVRTVVFGRSSRAEVKEFVKSFNAVMDAARNPSFGQLPIEFFSFDVESVSCITDKAPIGVRSVHGVESTFHLGTPGSSVPARIHFGFWTLRWDIVIPWSYSTMKDFRGDFQLEFSFHST